VLAFALALLSAECAPQMYTLSLHDALPIWRGIALEELLVGQCGARRGPQRIDRGHAVPPEGSSGWGPFSTHCSAPLRAARPRPEAVGTRRSADGAAGLWWQEARGRAPVTEPDGPTRPGSCAASAPAEGASMSDPLYPQATPAVNARRKELAPEADAAFAAFSKAVFADGA